MHPHHERALQSLVATSAQDRTHLALILSGSLARGTARPDSDIDVYVVMSEQDTAARSSRCFLLPADYEGGYVDAKTITPEMLSTAAERGAEPMRASFVGAQVLRSTVDGLEETVAQIPVYPEASRARNMADFAAAFVIHAWYFAPQALVRDDPFYARHSVTATVHLAGRMMLALNRVLYPCPKQLFTALGSCTDLPDGFVERCRRLLHEPTVERVADLATVTAEHADWGQPLETLLDRFVELDEWAWVDQRESLLQR